MYNFIYIFIFLLKTNFTFSYLTIYKHNSHSIKIEINFKLATMSSNKESNSVVGFQFLTLKCKKGFFQSLELVYQNPPYLECTDTA